MQVAKWTLFLLASLVFAAAVARTIRHPMNWAMDVATFLFAWCVFLGADVAMRDGRLFCIRLVLDKLPVKVQYRIEILNYLIIAVFLAGMIGYGLYLSYTTRLRTFQGIPGFSYTWVTLSVPVGCGLMLFTAVLKIHGFQKALRSGAKTAPQGTATTEII